MLRSAHGAWVPLPEILALGIAQYNARIWELRKRGLNIENRTEIVDGVRHSWFRLIPIDAPKSAQPAPKPGKSWDEIVADRERKLANPEPFELVP